MTPCGTDYWATTGGERWAAGRERLDPILAPLTEALRPAAASCRTGRIVDVGCGAGASTLMLREAAPDAEITGLDVSETMVEVAEARVRATGDTRTRFVCGDAAVHPIAPGSVDLIVSRLGVMFFDEPVAAFAHMGGWLRPTGRMELLLWAHPDHNRWIAEPLGALARHLSPVEPPGLEPGPYSLCLFEHRARVFRDAGLVVVRDQPFEAPVVVEGTLEQRIGFYTRHGRVRAALDRVSASGRVALMNDLREWVLSVSVGERITLPSRAIHVVLRRPE